MWLTVRWMDCLPQHSIGSPPSWDATCFSSEGGGCGTMACCGAGLRIAGGACILMLPRGSWLSDVDTFVPIAVPVEYEGDGDWIAPERPDKILAEVDNETLGSPFGHPPGTYGEVGRAPFEALEDAEFFTGEGGSRYEFDRPVVFVGEYSISLLSRPFSILYINPSMAWSKERSIFWLSLRDNLETNDCFWLLWLDGSVSLFSCTLALSVVWKTSSDDWVIALEDSRDCIWLLLFFVTIGTMTPWAESSMKISSSPPFDRCRLSRSILDDKRVEDVRCIDWLEDRFDSWSLLLGCKLLLDNRLLFERPVKFAMLYFGCSSRDSEKKSTYAGGST